MNTHSYLRFVATICLLLIVTLMIAACTSGVKQVSSAPAASAPPPAAQSASGQQTFGKEDCAKLLSFEEIEAALGTAADVVNVTEAGTCDYEDKDGF